MPKRSSRYQSHHDSLFRAAFSRPGSLESEATALLKPALVRTLDFSRVEVLQTRFVDESLGASESDATFRVPQHGRPTFFYVLLEHQRRSDALMPWRLLRYMTNVWMTLLGKAPGTTRLPMLIPMVLSNVPGGWRGPTRLREVLELAPRDHRFVAQLIPDFEFALDDLALKTTDELLRRRGPAFTRLALWLLASSSNPERVLDEAPRWSDLAAHLRGEAPDDHRRALLYLRRTVPMTEKQWKKIRKLFWMGPETREVTLEDIAFAGLEEERATARQQGLERGLEQGLERGREEGLAAQRALVKELWAARFGKVPRTVSTKLAKADAPTLRRWGKRLVTAKHARDVLA